MSNRASVCIRLIHAAFASCLVFGCVSPENTAPVAKRPATAPAPPSTLTLDFELEMKNPALPREGVLTGGQPTLADLETLAERGYRTVVNLRTTSETGQEGEIEKIAALGMDYVAVPIAGTDDLTPENARALATLLGDPNRRPLLLHCGSSSRVGALLALSAFHGEGASAEEALALGRAGGLTRLEDAVQERLVRTEGK